MFQISCGYFLSCDDIPKTFNEKYSWLARLVRKLIVISNQSILSMAPS